MKNLILLSAFLFFSVLINAQTYNYEHAVTAYEADDYQKALDYLNRDLKDNPKSANSYCYRALVYIMLDKNAAALTDINIAIKFTPVKDKADKAYNYFVRARIYSRMEEYQKAIADLSVSIKNAPTDKDYYIERGNAHVDAKEFAKGELDYRTALKMDEGEVLAWSGIGRSNFIQNKHNEAIKIFSKVIKLSPEYPLPYYYKARSNFELKNYDAAIEGVFHTLKLGDANGVARKEFLRFCDKNIALSLSKLNMQILSEPNDAYWYSLRAEVWKIKCDYLSAIADYNKTMQLDGEDNRSENLSLRAECFSELGNYTQAITDFDTSIALDSTNAYYYGQRGDAKRLMGKYAESVEDFSKAIAIEPNESWFYYRRGWVIDEFLKDTQGGLTDYNQAILVDKNTAYTYLNRGRLYETQLKDTVKAREDYATILKLDTAVLAQGNCRHYALFHLGRNEEAISWLKKIIDTYPTEGNYYDAACLYALMNKPAESVASLKSAFEHGYVDFIHLSKDDDLNNVRNFEEFKALVKEWKKKNDKSQTVVITERLLQNETIVEGPSTVSLNMIDNGSGPYEIKCEINDLPLKFIFDTGASDISISQTEVDFMLKNGYLKKADIGGSQSYEYANGSVEVGTKIILRKVNIGGFILKNVGASIVHTKNAPLLIGQSALNKYGKIIIDNDKKTITICKK